MKKRLISLVFTLGLLPLNIVLAADPAQQLSTCLTDAMSGKERKELAKWIYFGMSAHSALEPYSAVSGQDMNGANQYVGELMTRLFTEDCAKQTVAAAAKGSQAFKQAFSVVGVMAMQELMAEPSVGNALGGTENYFDRTKFMDLFE